MEIMEYVLRDDVYYEDLYSSDFSPQQIHNCFPN